MTTEEKKPIEVQITEGPHWKKILTEIFPYGHEAKFTVRINQTEAKMFAKILAMGTGDSRYIHGIFLRLDKNFISCLRPALRPVSENCRIFFHGEYNKDAGKGAIRPYVLTYDKDSCSDFLFVWNQTKPQYLSEAQIESMLNLQNESADAEKKNSVGVADAQMAELKTKLISRCRSADASDIGMKFFIYLLDQSDRLTRPVQLALNEKYSALMKTLRDDLKKLIAAGAFKDLFSCFGTNFDLYAVWLPEFTSAHARIDDNTLVLSNPTVAIKDNDPIELNDELLKQIENCQFETPQVGITDAQMAELKRAIMNSPDGDDFGRKAICWLLGKSENLTKRVALTFPKEFDAQGKSASHTAHAFVSVNCATRFGQLLKNLHSDFMLMNHGCSFVGDKWEAANKNGGTVWILNKWYDPQPTVYRADAKIVTEIENYQFESPTADKAGATDEKIRNLKAAILANEQRISPFCRKILLWLIDDSKFTMPSELIFSEEFGNFGKEIYETFKDAGKDDIDSYQNVLDQLFADFPTDFSVTALLHSGINNKYSIRLAPPKAEEKLMHMKTVDAKLLNEIQGIPLK